MKDDKIFITENEAKKLMYLQLLLKILAVVIGFCVLFLPIFESSIRMLDKALKAESVAELDSVSASFSYVSELIFTFDQLSNDSVGFSDVFFSPFVIFIIIVLIFAVTVIGDICAIVRMLPDVKDPAAARKRLWEKKCRYSKDKRLLSYSDVTSMLGDIVLVVVDGIFAPNGDSIVRYMIHYGFDNFSFSNFSSLFVLVVILAAAYIAVAVYAYVTDGRICNDIPRRKQARKDENRRQNELAHQRNLERKRLAEQQMAEEERRNAEATAEVGESEDGTA